MNAPLMTEIKIQPPQPLLPDTAPPTTYPVDALPPLMRDAALAITKHVQAPLALAAQCVIGAVTHLAQTRVNAPHLHNPDGMPCSLFMLTLAESADRKDSCRKLAFKPVDELERKMRARHREECECIIAEANQLRGKDRDAFLAENPPPVDRRTQYSDATWEPIVGDFVRGKPAASWDTSEGGQMLGGATLKSDTRTAAIGGMCLAFDSGDFERTRARGNAEGSGFAYSRRLSIHLLAQPIAVADALADPLLRGQGFLPRFLFASPDSIAGTRLLTHQKMATSSYADSDLQRYWGRCQEIIDSPEHIDRETGEVTPPVLALVSDATQVWMDFYNETESQQGPLGQFSDMRPFAGRAGEIARRLAAVFACFEGIELIDGECMHRACQIVSYSLAEWLRYSDSKTADPLLFQAAALMAWLRDPKRADSWQVFHINKLGKSGPTLVRGAKMRDKLLAVLLKHQHLLTYDGKTFRVNPTAEAADSAQPSTAPRVAGVKRLRKAAEKPCLTPTDRPTDAANPQSSATNSYTGRPVTRTLPQHPQNPGTSAPADARREEPWELTL